MKVWHDGEVIDIVEQIKPESLKRASFAGMIAARNHNFDEIMGRTDTNTLQYGIDDKGVWYRFDAPETGYGNDLLTQIRSKLITGSSFTFDVDMEQGFEINERADGKIEASPVNIKNVYEMGPVVMPAYPQTTAENRSALLQAVGAYLKYRDEKKEKDSIDYAAKRAEKYPFLKRKS